MFLTNYMKNKFSERLLSLRIENILSKAQLAEKLNISIRLISYWENGQRECNFDILLTLSCLFSVSIDFLLGLSDY